jgi:cytochrome c553
MKTSIFLLATLLLASTVQAAELKGNPKAGKTLAYTCTGCHGIAEYKNAYPNYRVPKIAGQHEKYISSALHEYKKGERNHPTMKAQASSFSDQDIADLAAYLSSLKPTAK